MSFSSDVKNEIVHRKCTVERSAISELGGMVCFGGKLRESGGEPVFLYLSENPKIARRAYSLMKGALGISSKIRIRKSGQKVTGYEVVVENPEDIERLYRAVYLLEGGKPLKSFVNYRIDKKLVPTRGLCADFIKGAFVSCGAVMNPQKNYHLEFSTGRYCLANDFMRLLSDTGIPAKLVTRKSKYVMYYKNSEEIADVLTILGAVNALMEYHNARIVKEMRNKINRTVNCETANLSKTVDASLEQVTRIEKLIEKGVFDTLPDNLKEIGMLRLTYREHSLKELGEMLDPPIGKSGVNHRLRKLMAIADSL